MQGTQIASPWMHCMLWNNWNNRTWWTDIGMMVVRDTSTVWCCIFAHKPQQPSLTLEVNSWWLGGAISDHFDTQFCHHLSRVVHSIALGKLNSIDCIGPWNKPIVQNCIGSIALNPWQMDGIHLMAYHCAKLTLHGCLELPCRLLIGKTRSD